MWLRSLSSLILGSLCLPFKELVVQKGWRLPEYMVTQESGPAHRKEFTMTCRVERFIEIGNGTVGLTYHLFLPHSDPEHKVLLCLAVFYPSFLCFAQLLLPVSSLPLPIFPPLSGPPASQLKGQAFSSSLQ